MNLVEAAAIGVGLGAVTGMPLGVVNVAIVDAAIAGRRRFALGVGLGGAAADMVHAALAFAGVGRAVTERPDLVRALAIAAAVVIAAYAAVAWRRRPAPDTPAVDDGRAPSDEAAPGPRPLAAPDQPAAVPPTRVAPRGLLRGFGVGAALTLPNPGALTAWVAVAASLAPRAGLAEAAVLAAGVGAGSAAWFALLARAVARLPAGHRALRIIPRAALAALVGLAAVGVARAI